jgi:hypothetical protein
MLLVFAITIFCVSVAEAPLYASPSHAIDVSGVHMLTGGRKDDVLGTVMSSGVRTELYPIMGLSEVIEGPEAAESKIPSLA